MNAALKTARKNLGLTQAQAATKANISTRAYQSYERGERTPSTYAAQSIANALQSAVAVLFPLKE